MNKAAGFIAMAVVAATCGGCSLYSESDMYEIAAAAVQADTNFPPSATILPQKNADFHVGKSAACVYVGYTDGGRVNTFAVWLKRIGIRWKIDRIEKSKTYSDTTPPQAQAAPISAPSFQLPGSSQSTAPSNTPVQ